ncbi:AaceriACR017Wp [[Ashbya] aceris (nom. inval.)]|nr:AaceriACR017Wp [[Ashbya] aceris (nom. inval.)]
MSDYEDDNTDVQSLTVEEEYELWNSNVPVMYEFVSETKLTWPSLTIQWLPSDAETLQQSLIFGTHTAGEETNYLKVATIDLPAGITGVDHGDEEDEANSHSSFAISKRFPHIEEVIRARYMPANSNIIATINGKGTISIFDRTLEESKAQISTLAFHKENGYGLAFNPHISGELLSGSDDTTVALWDIEATKKPKSILTTHDDIVNDVKWHEFDSNIFGTVSEDKTLQVHDKRVRPEPVKKLPTASPFNTLAFSKHSRNLLAAAGVDSQIYLYDMRDMSSPLHVMSGHQDSVTTVEFSPHTDGIICSSGSDRRAIIWDLTQIGAEQSQDDADDGAPELMMMHAGHRSPVNEFSFNPQIPWLLASTEEDNVIQAWKVSAKLVNASPPAIPDSSLLV